MKFKDILDEVSTGCEFALPQSTDWLVMDSNGIIRQTNGSTYVIERWMFDENNWQVKKEDIYIYGICNEYGECFISTIESDHISTNHSRLKLANGIFPKWKNKKFKLVPVEEL